MLPSSADRVPSRPRPRTVSTIGRWTLLSLSAEAPMPGRAEGYALLWAMTAMRVHHGGREAALGAGDLLIVDRSLPLGVEEQDGGEWRGAMLSFGDRRVGTRIGDRQRFLGLTLRGGGDIALAIKRLWRLLEDIGALHLGGHEAGDEVVEARLIEVMVDLTARLAAHAVDQRVSSYDAGTIERAQLLISAHVSDHGFGVSELAAQMRVSARHLSSLFARTGTTTSQAILDARLALAKQLLSNPIHRHRQIASVALACGFEDQSYFARCFRRNVGMTPRAFRKSRIGE